jgi:KaiC/GvpD/RAD55 family RecA-like ATPase
VNVPAVAAPAGVPSPGLWNKVLEAARPHVNPHSFSTWFHPTKEERSNGKRLVVRVPTSLFLKRLRETYGAVIHSALAEVGYPQMKLKFVWKEGSPDKFAYGVPPAPVLPRETAAVTRFVLTPLAELLSRPDEPIDYVLENRLVAGTVSVVVAKPKVGKSTFARNLCLAISRGEDFLGLKTKCGECIYLALEEREEEVRADFRAMGADGGEPILIHAASAPAEGIRALCDLMRERRPVFVVIDPLFRLARIRDEKAYAETYAALGPLIDAARLTGTHVQATHHAGKSMKADAIDSPLGSTAIGGAFSALLVMRRTEAYRTLQSVQRVGPDMVEGVLKFDADSKRISLSGTRFEADRTDCEQEILAFLMAAGGPQTQEQIRDSVEGQTRVTRAALTALVAVGRVVRTGDGKRGKPFLYECWFSGSQHIAGTREPESENTPHPLSNVDEFLVPEIPPKSILVPDIEQCDFEAGNAAGVSAAETMDQLLLDASDCVEEEEI